jgi:hypothetical protein
LLLKVLVVQQEVLEVQYRQQTQLLVHLVLILLLPSAVPVVLLQLIHRPVEEEGEEVPGF